MEREEFQLKELDYIKRASKSTMAFCGLIGIILLIGDLFKFISVPSFLYILAGLVFIIGLILYILNKRNLYIPLSSYLITTITTLALTVGLGFINPLVRNLFFLIYFYIVLHPAYFLGMKKGLYGIVLVDVSYALMVLLTDNLYPESNLPLEFFKLVIFTFLTFLIVSDFDKDLKRMQRMRKLLIWAEQGDLTIRLQRDKENDELSFLTKSFNNLINKLSAIVGAILDVARSLNDMGNRIASTAGELSSSIAEIVATTQKMTDGVDHQYHELENSINVSKSLGEVSFNVVSNIKKVENYAHEFLMSATDALEKSDKLIKNIEIIGTRYQYLITLMVKLSSVSDTINKIIETINSISEKINILSLNASIEAARAGEYGRGFSIVADEVKKLADNTQVSAAEISKIMKEMIDSIKIVAESSEEVKKAISDGSLVVKSTTESLNSISQGVMELNNAVKEIKEVIAHQEKEITNIIKRIEDSFNISKENSASAEEILAALEQQSAASQEFTATSQGLVAIVNRLNEITKNFKI